MNVNGLFQGVPAAQEFFFSRVFILYSFVVVEMKSFLTRKHRPRADYRANNVASILHHLAWNGAWSGSFRSKRTTDPGNAETSALPLEKESEKIIHGDDDVHSPHDGCPNTSPISVAPQSSPPSFLLPSHFILFHFFLLYSLRSTMATKATSAAPSFSPFEKKYENVEAIRNCTS